MQIWFFSWIELNRNLNVSPSYICWNSGILNRFEFLCIFLIEIRCVYFTRIWISHVFLIKTWSFSISPIEIYMLRIFSIKNLNISLYFTYLNFSVYSFYSRLLEIFEKILHFCDAKSLANSNIWMFI